MRDRDTANLVRLPEEHFARIIEELLVVLQLVWGRCRSQREPAQVVLAAGLHWDVEWNAGAATLWCAGW